MSRRLRAHYLVTLTRPSLIEEEGEITKTIRGRVGGSVISTLPAKAWRLAHNTLKKWGFTVYSWRYMKIELWREDL